MKRYIKISTLLFVSIALSAACSKNSGNSASPAPKTGPASLSNPSAPQGGEAQSTTELSEDLEVNTMTINRLMVGDKSLDSFDSNPKGSSAATTSWAAVSTLCAPRFNDTDMEALSESTYPIIMTADSQVLLRQDTARQIGGSSDYAPVVPYTLLTCTEEAAKSKKPQAYPNISAPTPSVDFKRLHPGETTLEVLSTYPQSPGMTFSQSGALTNIGCAPRLNDAKIKSFTRSAQPLVLTVGSQIAIRRGINFQFDPNSEAANAPEVVVITCEK